MIIYYNPEAPIATKRHNPKTIAITTMLNNTNLTISQQLKNFFYTVVGKDTYIIAASHAGLVTATGI